MGAKNKYVDNLPVIYRKSILDVMIYSFISGQRFALPSVSVEESAKSFLSYHKINEDELSVEKITRTFWRIQKETYDEQKTAS